MRSGKSSAVGNFSLEDMPSRREGGGEGEREGGREGESRS